MEIKKNVSLDEAYKGSFYTIVGAGGEIKDWIKGYNDKLAEAGIGKPLYWTSFSGKDVNTHYHLREFPDDLVFLAFPLDNLHIGKLAGFKLGNGDMWFDDLIDNLSSEEEEEFQVEA